MIIAKIITIFSILVWCLPPLRQFRGAFFYFFLLQAISDPLALICLNFSISAISLKVIIASLLFLAVYDPKKILRNSLFGSPIIGLLFYLSFYSNRPGIIFFLILIHVSIIFLILKKYLNEISFPKVEISLFSLLILFYEATIVTKYFVNIVNIDKGVYYFYLTSAFDILLGIAFCFVREEDKHFSFNFER